VHAMESDDDAEEASTAETAETELVAA
jgi:hypothetical protein